LIARQICIRIRRILHMHSASADFGWLCHIPTQQW